MPVNVNSAAQQLARSILAAVSRDWAALSEAERAAWTMYADNTPVTDRYGYNITLSGSAMYTRVNCARLSAGLITLSAAPTTFGLPASDPLISATIVAEDGEASVVFDPTQEWATQVGGKLLLYAGRPKNGNIAYYGGPFKQIEGVSGAVVAPTSPATVTMPDALAAGQNIWINYRILTADGRLSNTFRIGPITVSAGS